MRRVLLVCGLLVLLLLAGLGWWRRRDAPPAPSVAADTPSSEPSRTARPSSPPEPGAASPEQRREARARRDDLRATILRALEAARANAPGPPSPTSAAPSAPRPPGTLTDRIGGREALAARLNQDFMPLADECIEQARERTPELAGMLVIGIETVADKELGAVVEQAEAAPTNAVIHAELLECIRETALSLRLPAPPESGREKFEITLRIEPAKRGR